MKILTFNARVWTRDTDNKSPRFWKKRMAAMEKMIKTIDPDIICFQELSVPATSYVPDNYRRVGLTVSHPVYVKRCIDTSKHDFKIHMDRLLVNGKLQIINVHSRWETSVIERNCKNVEKYVAQGYPTIVCGDFNNEADKINLPSLKLAQMVPYEDTFINFDRPTESHGILDLFYTTGVNVISCSLIKDGYGAERISDHYPVLLQIDDAFVK